MKLLLRPVALIGLTLMAGLQLECFPQRVNSTAKKLKVVKPTEPLGLPEAMVDTVAATADMVRFAGYDKSLRATRETVFVTNLSPTCEIRHVVFHITYFDAQGRQLHRARHSLYAPVPVGETRRLDFPSWDKQFSFFYARSARPRKPAIPYTVKITPDTLIVIR